MLNIKIYPGLDFNLATETPKLTFLSDDIDDIDIMNINTDEKDEK